MICEYRSDDVELLAYMKEQFNRIFTAAENDEVKINVKLIGERPCASPNVDPRKMNAIKRLISPIVEEVTGSPLTYKKSSTDCNIPLSLGIPGISIGVYRGGKGHTREEWVEKASLVPGLEIGIRSALEFTKQ